MDKAELQMLALGSEGNTFMIGKDMRTLAISFGLLATGLIEIVGEHIPDDKPETYWLAKLTPEGAAVLAEHKL